MPSLSVELYFAFTLVLFAIGLFGFMFRRSLIMMFISAEIMLMAINVSFVALSLRYYDSYWQVVAALTIAVAASEAAIGLILFIYIFKLRGASSSEHLNILR